MSHAFAYDAPQSRVMPIDIATLNRSMTAAHTALAKAFGDLIIDLDAAASAEEGFDLPSLLKLTQQMLCVDDLEMSRILKVSRPTIGRWIRGISAPHPLARKAIFAVLAGKSRAKLKALSV
jgi:hypothetical protein